MITSAESESVVFTGVSGCFAGAPTPRAFWKATLRKQCFLEPYSDADAGRLVEALLPGCRAPEVCAALGENFACRADHIPLPTDLGVGDNPDFWFAAQLIHDALANAGLAPSPGEGRTDRLALYVGYDSAFNPAAMNWMWHAAAIGQIVGTLQRFFPGATFGQIKRLREELSDTLPLLKHRQLELARGEGVVRLLAQTFGACDMACQCAMGEASVFAGLESAANALRLGQCDVAAVVALQPPIPPTQLAGEAALTPFSPLRALAPFSSDPKGTLPGEGGAAFVLRRLSDARREGTRPYAKLHGSAVVAGLPPADGGLEESLRRALHRALRRLPNGFRDVDYWEMNASGIGEEDEAERAVLRLMTNNRGAHIPLLALGSAKTAFGNAFTAAGALGVLKGVLAVGHRVLPPSVTPVDDFAPALAPDQACYWVQEARPWIAASTRKRRLAVSTLSRFGRAGAATLEEVSE